MKFRLFLIFSVVVSISQTSLAQVSGSGLRFQQEGLWVEAFAVPVESEAELEIASRGIAAEISKDWIKGKTEFETITADTPTDGTYPKAEVQRKMNPQKLMTALMGRLEKTRIRPDRSALLKLAPQFGGLRHLHVALGSGIWGYTAIRITVTDTFVYWAVIAGNSPLASLTAVIHHLKPLVDFAVKAKLAHRSIASQMIKEEAADQVRRVLRVPESNSFERLRAKKLVERKADQAKVMPVSFAEMIFSESIAQLIHWMQQKQKQPEQPLSAGKMMQYSLSKRGLRLPMSPDLHERSVSVEIIDPWSESDEGWKWFLLEQRAGR